MNHGLQTYIRVRRYECVRPIGPDRYPCYVHLSSALGVGSVYILTVEALGYPIKESLPWI